MTKRYFTVAQIEERFDEILNFVSENNDTIFILDEIGVPTCVMISACDFEKMNQALVSETDNLANGPQEGNPSHER